MMRIVFLLPVPSHARYHKRIKALEHLGAKAEILSFERDYYAGKPWLQGYTSLGYVRHGHYYRRLFSLAKALRLVRPAAERADVIYAFGLDTLMLAWLASMLTTSQPKIVYEVGDIREALVSGTLSGWLLRLIERFLVHRCDLVVVTSRAYINGYFVQIQQMENVRYLVIENKLDSSSFVERRERSPKATGKEIKIGYFGLIRCYRSWEVLKGVAKKGNGRFRFIIRGILMGNMKNLEREIKQTPFVEFGGPYIFPDDLPEMYESADLIWIAQLSSETHFKWSRVNRFYEACYFQCPMIAQKGTQDALVVEKYNIGLCVDLHNMEEAIQRVLSIDIEQIRRWHENIAKVPSYICVYVDEHERLLTFLQSIGT